MNTLHDMTHMDPVAAYMALARQHPALFVQNDQVPIVLDEARIRAYAARTGRPMGVVYDNVAPDGSRFYTVVADLCLRGEREFSYSRVIYPNPTNGSVAVPRMGNRFGLLKLFRHVPRMDCLEFPRGFAKQGLSPTENIKEELWEEMGAWVEDMEYLGRVRADTGLSAGFAEVFLADVRDARANVGHEGIRELVWLEERELNAAIARGEITDGFTLSALTLLRCKQTD